MEATDDKRVVSCFFTYLHVSLHISHLEIASPDNCKHHVIFELNSHPNFRDREKCDTIFLSYILGTDMGRRKVSLEERTKRDPRVADVLKLLAAGVFLTSMILVPGMAVVGGVVVKELKRREKVKEEREWDTFNTWRLRSIIKNLQKQQVAKIDGRKIVITEKGKEKLLRYDIDEMQLRAKTDGKWRLIIYDIAEFRKKERDLFRLMLKRLKLYQLQRSVYLTPFPCENEIEYIRQYFGIGNDVQVIGISGLENESEYKRFFGL